MDLIGQQNSIGFLYFCWIILLQRKQKAKVREIQTKDKKMILIYAMKCQQFFIRNTKYKKVNLKTKNRIEKILFNLYTLYKQNQPHHYYFDNHLVPMLTKQWVEKLTQFKKLQKTPSLNYTILKTLWQSLQEESSLAKTDIFQLLLKTLPAEIHSLGLYSELIHRIWRNENYAIGVREGCCPNILFVVTEWIMYFELQSEKADSMGKKFRLLKEFLLKHSKSIQTSILIIEQVHEDLKDLFDTQFWSIQQQQTLHNNSTNKYSKLLHTNQQSQQHVDSFTSKQLISLLQLISFRQLQVVYHNNKQQQQPVDFSCYLSAAKYPATNNYYELLFQCINYLLELQLSQSEQSQATRFAFQFMRSLYCLQNKKLLVSLFKKLMTSTQKAVRFALVQQYMDMYKMFSYLEMYDIIEELQEMVFFRQLIVGHAKITESVNDTGSQQRVSESYESGVMVKAGGKQRVYFSLQDAQSGIMKLELTLQEGMDINLRFYHFTIGNKEILYHEVQKTDLSKLHLKLDFTGLYALQFDNSYSWISNKHIRYHLHLLKYVSITEIMEANMIQNI